MTPRLRAGVTLLELMVVLVILGLIMTVVGLSPAAVSRVRPVKPWVKVVADLRTTAIDSGHPITRTIVVDSVQRDFTAYPDGEVLGDSVFAVDRFTGHPLMAERDHVAR